MNIVGIYDFPAGSFRAHDKSAAVINKNLFYAYEEAKISEIKEDGYALFPERALMMGFKEFSLKPNEVDIWVFPLPPDWINKKLVLRNFFECALGISFKNEKEFDDFYNKKIQLVSHHDAHIAIGAYTSQFKEGIVLSMDGGGDYGDINHIVCKRLNQGKVENSTFLKGEGSSGLANFHGWLTESVGFIEDGKCSGIAGYGEIRQDLYTELRKLLLWDDSGYFTFIKKRIPLKYYGFEKVKIDSYDRKKFIYHQPGLTNLFELVKKYKPQDIAATGTKVIIDCLIQMLRAIKSKSNTNNIVLVGGLFNNVAINRAIVESNIFTNCYFTMAPGDAGLALGLALKALYSSDTVERDLKNIFSPYIGPSFKNDENKILLDQMKLNYEFLDDTKIGNFIACKIASGATIGTFYGRAEFGPRSLGHRSILGDARSIETKQKINLNLKKRDWFMPYAPAILAEDAPYWTNINPSPYMQIASLVNENKRSFIPSAVHTDGSARFQVVHNTLSPFFYDVIHNFKEITGIPIVLNTSFNRHGIATIASPRSAIHHLLEGTVDYLILGNYVISFNQNRISSKKEELFNIQEERKLLLDFESMYKKKIFDMEKLLKYERN